MADERFHYTSPFSRVDSSEATAFDIGLQEAVEGLAPGDSLLINMFGVEYVNSDGLRAMVSALREVHKKRGKSEAGVVLYNSNPRILEALKLAGLDTLFTFLYEELPGDE